MNIFDMRFWSERRIALSGVVLGIFSLIVSSITSCYFSNKANDLTIENNKISAENTKISKEAHELNQRTFCLNLILPKLESINSQLKVAPELITACSDRPKIYCAEARDVTSKLKQDLMDVTPLLNNDGKQLVDLLNTLNGIEKVLFKTIKGNEEELVTMTEQLIVKIRGIQTIDSRKINCTKQ